MTGTETSPVMRVAIYSVGAGGDYWAIDVSAPDLDGAANEIAACLGGEGFDYWVRWADRAEIAAHEAHKLARAS